MMINYGGCVPLSCIDYPGFASMTIFLRGCHVRCSGCHNKHLWEGSDMRDEAEIFHMIDSAGDMISAVVISGGEPLEQPEAIRAISQYAHGKGLRVGLHTSGRGNLANVIECADMILLSRPERQPWNVEVPPC